MIIYTFFNLITSLLSLLLPYISGVFIDNLVIGQDKLLLFKMIGLILVINICQLILGYVSKCIYTVLQAKAGFTLNFDVLKHLKSISPIYLQDQDTAYLNQRINNDANAIIIFCINVIVRILVNSSILLVSSIFLLKTNTSMGILLLLLTISHIILYKVYKKPLYNKSHAKNESQNKLFSNLYEQLHDINFIKMHAVKEIYDNRLLESFKNLLHSALVYNKTAYLFSSSDVVIKLLAQLTIFIVGGIEVISGNLTVGFFTILLSYFNMMLNATTYFFNLGKDYQNNFVYYNRLKEILDIPEIPEGITEISTIDTISVNNLSFNFKDKNILDNINLQFSKGNIYCISGENGRGKSTFIDILVGLYKREYSGELLFNNEDINDLNMYSVRNNLIGITEQQPYLMRSTILSNLELGKNYSLESITDLCDIFNLTDFFEKQPHKFNTLINEQNKNLSGGEKQKIALIRTFLKDPELIILDEPTSALDIDSIDKFIKYISKIKQDKIIIIITHNNAIRKISNVDIEL